MHVNRPSVQFGAARAEHGCPVPLNREGKDRRVPRDVFGTVQLSGLHRGLACSFEFVPTVSEEMHNLVFGMTFDRSMRGIPQLLEQGSEGNMLFYHDDLDTGGLELHVG
jgi:hypothetical protein